MVLTLIAWTKQILYLIFLVLLIQLIMPENKLKSYLQLVLGLLVISIVLEPMVTFIKRPPNVDEFMAVQSTPMEGASTGYWIERGENLRQSSEQRLLDEATSLYADQIKALLKLRFEGLEVEVCSMKLSPVGVEHLRLEVVGNHTKESETVMKDLLFGVYGISPSVVAVNWNNTDGEGE